MADLKKFSSLKSCILRVQAQAKCKKLSISDILQSLSKKGRPLILVLLCLPFCQPLQIPGLSLPFGIAIAFFGLSILFGKKIWLPKKLLEKKISSKLLIKLTTRALKLTRKIKPWVYPRLHWICHSIFMEKANALAISILGLFLSLPLPIPLSNLSAAWSILLIAIGIMEDDGLFILIGYLICLLTLAVFLAIFLNIQNIFIKHSH